MAIYGQMTSQGQASKDAEEGDDITSGTGEVVPHDRLSSSLPASTDKLAEEIVQATSELEGTLSQLTDGIDKKPAARATPQPSEPPHFTLGTSPTHRRASDTEPQRNPPIL